MPKRRCPWCGNIVNGHPNKKFCNTKHKDKYHNNKNPRGIYKHLHPNHIHTMSIEDEMHPGDPYSLGQE